MQRLFILLVGLFWSLTNTSQSLAQLNTVSLRESLPLRLQGSRGEEEQGRSLSVLSPQHLSTSAPPQLLRKNKNSYPSGILAQLNYSEKKNQNQQQTSSGAMRGCRGNLPKLQLLAPPDEIAFMGSEQTFLLNLSELSPYPLKISILEPYVPESLWSTELRPKKSGLIKVPLPKTIDLKTNQDYIFTATIPCDQNIPSSNIYVRALFQKIPVRSQDTLPEKQVSLLLDQGIWYDALWISFNHQLPIFKKLLEQQGIELDGAEEQKSRGAEEKNSRQNEW